MNDFLRLSLICKCLHFQPISDDNGQLDAGESRIRVRNWLMLADQSIIDKTSDDSTGI